MIAQTGNQQISTSALEVRVADIGIDWSVLAIRVQLQWFSSRGSASHDVLWFFRLLLLQLLLQLK